MHGLDSHCIPFGWGRWRLLFFSWQICFTQLRVRVQLQANSSIGDSYWFSSICLAFDWKSVSETVHGNAGPAPIFWRWLPFSRCTQVCRTQRLYRGPSCFRKWVRCNCSVNTSWPDPKPTQWTIDTPDNCASVHREPVFDVWTSPNIQDKKAGFLLIKTWSLHCPSKKMICESQETDSTLHSF